MNKISLLSSSLLLISVVLGATVTPITSLAKDRSPTIGTIEQKIEAGCGCGFRLAGKSSQPTGIIFTSAAGESIAIANIDGKDVRLREVEKMKSYSDGSISVTLNLKEAKKEYESTGYMGKIIVTRAGKVTTRKISGACGC